MEERRAPTAQPGALVQYLTFRLGPEEYALEILRVQEIRAISAITPVPNTLPYVKGVMNLRGSVVPVLDLRARLGMTEAVHGRLTVIIVVIVDARAVGLVVDGVCDVLAISREDIESAPSFSGPQEGAFVAGLAHAGEKLVILLDLDAVCRVDEPAHREG